MKFKLPFGVKKAEKKKKDKVYRRPETRERTLEERSKGSYGAERDKKLVKEANEASKKLREAKKKKMKKGFFARMFKKK